MTNRDRIRYLEQMLGRIHQQIIRSRNSTELRFFQDIRDRWENEYVELVRVTKTEEDHRRRRRRGL